MSENTKSSVPISPIDDSCKATTEHAKSRVPRSTHAVLCDRDRLSNITIGESSNSLISAGSSSSQHTTSIETNETFTQIQLSRQLSDNSLSNSDNNPSERDDISSASKSTGKDSITTRQANLRKEILAIQKNDSIAPSEKAKLIQVKLK
jgi:hypothetical protein